MLRYKVKTLATLFLISIQFVGTAFAQSIYPNKSMRIVVGYPPGGTADQLARVLSEGVGKILGQNVIVENRPGANGNLAADFVAKSPADGYTLLMTAPGPVSVNMHVYPSLPFDPKTAFAPIARVAIAPLVLVVNKQLPVQNLKELLAYAKANPSKASYASQGNASSGHLAMELLKSRTALQAEHVPYKGSSPALNDLLAGHVLMMFDNTTSSLPQVRSGNLKAIAIAEDKRIAAAPDIPTVAESGYEGFSATPWFGLVTTAGTPNLVIQKWVASIHEVLKNPTIKDRFAQSGVDLVFDTPEAFSYYIESESRKWKEVVRISGARAD
ncbi:MAG: tripartite tricarboxylate transporter substrate binding protein [Betaproteobacteria bacterium]|nr:tripartite tricarboxylate transporter substrate binding protein [Betaproteobacteria bacterium]